ncbi:unnamed protein product [marine sediment metagenome]|uniref:Uncharacterized protein n=1 Tax=marine sediment metagenome TaxID=412755 RepID=X1EME3_9ZZZZ
MTEPSAKRCKNDTVDYKKWTDVKMRVVDGCMEVKDVRKTRYVSFGDLDDDLVFESNHFYIMVEGASKTRVCVHSFMRYVIAKKPDVVLAQKSAGGINVYCYDDYGDMEGDKHPVTFGSLRHGEEYCCYYVYAPARSLETTNLKLKFVNTENQQGDVLALN